ncbi:hypothetical protein L1887_47383 [Cichorium endivia]|nr:hypothetical protein L1887_47383 [Cichorium endivia]
MESTENVDERLLAAVMDEAQTDFSIASIAVEKIRQGAESIAAGMHGRNHVKASFEHYDASIGKSLGQEFLLKAPAALLEQFSAVAGNRNVADSGAMLAGLLHGFMIAFATRETEDRALKALLGDGRENGQNRTLSMRPVSEPTDAQCHFQKTTAPVRGAGPTGVQPTSERAVSAVLCTKYRKGPELLRTPLHDAALLCGRIVTTM